MGNLLLCANGYCCRPSHSQIRSLSYRRLLVKYNGKFGSVAPIRGDNHDSGLISLVLCEIS